MKYEGFQESNFIKIKNSNLSNFIEFKYSIEQSDLGRKIQGKYIRKFIRLFFNIFTISQVSNIYYKNINNSLSIYSKDWWKI